jgi:hypothetical protein
MDSLVSNRVIDSFECFTIDRLLWACDCSFEGVDSVMFVAALSEYDQTLFEDESTNRMEEALRLFSEICNSRWFKNTSIILFLNKRDILAEKVLKVRYRLAGPPYYALPFGCIHSSFVVLHITRALFV